MRRHGSREHGVSSEAPVVNGGLSQARTPTVRSRRSLARRAQGCGGSLQTWNQTRPLAHPEGFTASVSGRSDRSGPAELAFTFRKALQYDGRPRAGAGLRTFVTL